MPDFKKTQKELTELNSDGDLTHAYIVKVFNKDDKEVAEYMYSSIGRATEFQVGMQQRGYSTFMQVREV